MAVANFDRRAHSTIYAVLIKPSFRISEVIADPEDSEKMRCFLRDYQHEYATQVTEARELARQAARNDAIDSLRS